MSDAGADARYRAKLEARAAGAKAVVFKNPAAVLAAANVSPENARFQAKMAARVSVATAAEPPVAQSADDAEPGQAKASAAESKPKR